MTNLQTILLDEIIALKRHVNRLLGMGILFIVMAHFFIVTPYFQYQKKQEKLQSEWRINKNNLQDAKQKLEEVNKVNVQIQSVLKKVKQDIKNFPRELQGILPKIREELSVEGSEERGFSISQQTQQRQQFQAPPILPSNIKTFEEGINWYTKDKLNKMNNKLKNSIVLPLNNLDMFSKNNNIEGLFQKSDNDISLYITKINPNFWRTFVGKGQMAQNFSNVIMISFEPIFKEINKARKKLTERKNLKQNEYASLKLDIHNLKELKNNLKTRLKILESPIGKLPVGLVDFIKLFPIIVVIFIFMLTLDISRSSYLHEKLNKNVEIEDSSIDKSIFTNIINCWYLPPYQKKFEFTLLWGVLLLILFIYLNATYLILQSQEFFVSVIVQEGNMPYYLYMGFYLVGGSILLVCLSHIKKIR